jgi:hypothetical protein
MDSVGRRGSRDPKSRPLCYQVERQNKSPVSPYAVHSSPNRKESCVDRGSCFCKVTNQYFEASPLRHADNRLDSHDGYLLRKQYFLVTRVISVWNENKLQQHNSSSNN